MGITDLVIGAGVVFVGYKLFKCYQEKGELNVITLTECVVGSAAESAKDFFNEAIDELGHSSLASGMVEWFAGVGDTLGIVDYSGENKDPIGATPFKETPTVKEYIYDHTKFFSWDEEALKKLYPDRTISKFTPGYAETHFVNDEWIHKGFGGTLDASSKIDSHDFSKKPLYYVDKWDPSKEGLYHEKTKPSAQAKTDMAAKAMNDTISKVTKKLK